MDNRNQKSHMLRTREEWLQVVETGLPSEERFSERNRAITARYARWYLDYPEQFKWAGMAAFASRQVGMAVVSAEMLLAPERLGAANPLLWLHRIASGMFMVRDLEEMRTGNNSIFHDIAWAHAAYLEGGLDEIEGNAVGRDRNQLLEGFRLIDRGVKTGGAGSEGEEALRLVWQGNLALLRHEQTEVLQPVFDRLSPGGCILASFGSELDFSGMFPSGPRCVASFPSFHGYLETIAGMRSIADAGHRWKWIESSVMPAWMEADRRMQADPALKRELISMASAEPGVLNRFAEFAGGLIPGG